MDIYPKMQMFFYLLIYIMKPQKELVEKYELVKEVVSRFLSSGECDKADEILAVMGQWLEHANDVLEKYFDVIGVESISSEKH